MNIFARSLLLATFCFFSAACSESATTNTAIAGGAGGAAIGAGTGALIANANGANVGTSAIVGGAIGVPVGIVLSVGTLEYLRARDIRRNNNQINENTDQIRSTQMQIDKLREDMTAESSAMQPDESLAETIYDGPTVGQYRR